VPKTKNLFFHCKGLPLLVAGFRRLRYSREQIIQADGVVRVSRTAQGRSQVFMVDRYGLLVMVLGTAYGISNSVYAE